MKPDTELKLVKTTRLPGVVSRTYREVKVTEASIQATLKHALETCGYTVLEVAKGRSAKAKGLWVGHTPGCPDVFVSHPDWPIGEWLGLELKTPTGRVRPEQQALADAGRVVIVRGVYEGLCSVACVEYKLDANTVLAAPEKRKAAVMKMAEQFKEAK